MTGLAEILSQKRRDVLARKARVPLFALRGAPPLPALDFEAALRKPGLSVIAELKRRSPANGPIAENLDVTAVASAYAAGGASALSVLTDARFFGARPDDLPAAKHAAYLPVLCKDFVIDAYQIYEANHLGADAILLIVAALSLGELRDLMAVAGELRMPALVEVHDEAELESALGCAASIVGVNNRNLRTFEVDLEVSLRMRPLIPPGILTVAESGIRNRADVQRIQEAGFDAVLVGETLLRAADPRNALLALCGASSAKDDSSSPSGPKETSA
jgi:indole-3-glycerol phosphate synthase